ncbi:hypothetical protein GGR95_003209 [Sulfitobacter undariae]|uniref:Uncharacterized protein n=1 Tax=Sulfitobacter undariae TaxID=1563671 RepID=A0A7W6H1U3_9RHOB|nr:hypothetical protein [Sulfitobacter undariae]MBB3995552.1 hypothetical protein [Sulfitobacter undariae]
MMDSVFVFLAAHKGVARKTETESNTLYSKFVNAVPLSAYKHLMKAHNFKRHIAKRDVHDDPKNPTLMHYAANGGLEPSSTDTARSMDVRCCETAQNVQQLIEF